MEPRGFVNILFCLVDKQLNDIDVQKKKYLLNAGLISYLFNDRDVTCAIQAVLSIEY